MGTQRELRWVHKEESSIWHLSKMGTQRELRWVHKENSAPKYGYTNTMSSFSLANLTKLLRKSDRNGQFLGNSHL